MPHFFIFVLERDGPWWLSSLLFLGFIFEGECVMAMTRAEKEQEVTELKDNVFAAAETVIVVRNNGLDSEQTATLRKTMHKEGVKYRVAKNTLAKKALAGSKFEGISSLLTGPTAFAASKDPMAAARAAYLFAKDNEKFVIIGGASGNETIDLERIKFLALLPSLDALRGKLIGLLQAPGGQIARVVNAYAEKGGAGAAPAPAPAAAEAPQA
jgi:large subunit ribosomal protein L10